jgi:hypothetical protein
MARTLGRKRGYKFHGFVNDWMKVLLVNGWVRISGNGAHGTRAALLRHKGAIIDAFVSFTIRVGNQANAVIDVVDDTTGSVTAFKMTKMKDLLEDDFERALPPVGGSGEYIGGFSSDIQRFRRRPVHVRAHRRQR